MKVEFKKGRNPAGKRGKPSIQRSGTGEGGEKGPLSLFEKGKTGSTYGISLKGKVRINQGVRRKKKNTVSNLKPRVSPRGEKLL